MSDLMHGLVLAGGRSKRMGTDKAQLVYRDGRTQLQVVCELLESLGIKPYASLRSDQTDVPACAHDVVRDAFGEAGPLGAIASAQQNVQGVAWLVVACDLPLLDEVTLKELIDQRNGKSAVICFSSEHDGRPEPLCAIWEPQSSEKIMDAVRTGKLCARHLLEDGELSVRCIDPVVQGALDNANSPEDASMIRDRIAEKGKRTVAVRYYGLLGSRAGVSEESVVTNVGTLADLYLEQSKLHDLQLPLDSVRAAVNDEFVAWSTPVENGIDVAFMPPFCGG